MKELKVGERVTITLEAVEHSTCEGCFFKVVVGGYCGAALLGFMCVPKYRSDKKDVIFKRSKRVKRMTPKYIIGDIVMYDNKVMVIKEPRDSYHFDLSCHKEGMTYCFVYIDEIKPVSLTPAILEKNGWKRIFREYLGGDNVAIFWLNENIGDCAEFEEFNRHFSPKIFKLPIIHYVQQLQHYFFGLGIKIEIKA